MNDTARTEQPPVSEQEVSDQEILDRVASGEISAFDLLVQKYIRSVRGVIHGIVRSCEIAEDICQDTFLVAYRSFVTLECRNKFGSWLYSIARYQAYQYNRSRKRIPIKQTLPEEVEAIRDIRHYANPASRFYRDERLRMLHEAVNQIRPEYREVIELRYWQELSIREIVSFLGIPESTIKWRLHKARNALRTLILTTEIGGNR